MDRRIIYGGIGAAILLPVAIGVGAWQAGKSYRGNDVPAVTSPAPEEAKKPKFAYVRNLSEEVFTAVRTLDNVYRTQYNRGLPVFHIGQSKDHYVVVRGIYENEIFEAYLKTDRWGNITPNTSITIVKAQADGASSMPLLLTNDQYETFVDGKRHGVFERTGPKPNLPQFPDLPYGEPGKGAEKAAEQATIERGLETIVKAAEAETRRLAVGGQIR